MNLSKRSLIITAVAILSVIAAVFSVYLEKKETEKFIDELEELEPETRPEPKPKVKPETKVKEPEKPVTYEAGEPVK
jgi:hypothetical protein